MNAETYRAPWRINRDPNDRPAVYDAESNAVADCWRSVMLTLDEQRRNAELIARAPSLLLEVEGLRKKALHLEQIARRMHCAATERYDDDTRKTLLADRMRELDQICEPNDKLTHTDDNAQ